MPDLGSLDRAVMQLIWANRRLTAETVREKLARRLKESTVHSRASATSTSIP
jgi:BlaI family transcriptional regulator, penicillinase repressor